MNAFVSSPLLPPARRGKALNGLAHSSDWLPTIHAIAGIHVLPPPSPPSSSQELQRPEMESSIDKPDGFNLLPAILEEGVASPRTEVLHMIQAPNSSTQNSKQLGVLRSGRYKLIATPAGKFFNWSSPFNSSVPTPPPAPPPPGPTPPAPPGPPSPPGSCGASVHLQHGVKVQGDTVQKYSKPMSLAECCSACEANPHCMLFTSTSAKTGGCWLHGSHSTDKISRKQCTTGVVRNASTSTRTRTSTSSASGSIPAAAAAAAATAAAAAVGARRPPSAEELRQLTEWEMELGDEVADWQPCASTPCLYDLETDPEERHDLYSLLPSVAQQLEQRLHEVVGGWVDQRDVYTEADDNCEQAVRTGYWEPWLEQPTAATTTPTTLRQKNDDEQTQQQQQAAPKKRLNVIHLNTDDQANLLGAMKAMPFFWRISRQRTSAPLQRLACGALRYGGRPLAA